MASVVKFAESAHWYRCIGGEPKAQHDATLRDARKKLLYPSITTVLKDEFKNDFLDRWKTNELLLAASSTYKQPHESAEQYCQRIYDLSLEKANTAATFGKAIHQGIEVYPSAPANPEVAPWIDQFGQWYSANVDHPTHREKILLDHQLGLAGQCDFIGCGKGAFEGQIILPDWKTQGVKKDEKGNKRPNFYESWPRQLAFYAVAYSKEAGLFPGTLPTCISVVIDSSKADDGVSPAPGELIFSRAWTRDEILSAYEDVIIASYRWFKKRKYFPQPQGMFTISTSAPLPV